MANTDLIPKYEIRLNGEYATICVECTQAERSGETRYGGHLLVSSSFGAFAHQWTHCGEPFHEFLKGISFDSFIMKVRGEDAYVFDLEGTIAAVRQKLTDLAWVPSKEREMRELLDAADLAEASCEFEFMQKLADIEDEAAELCRNSSCLENPESFITVKPDPQLVQFWKELWPEFLKKLN